MPFGVPVALANLLELGGNQAGEQGSDPSPGNKGLSYSSQPHVDVVRCLVEAQQLVRHGPAVHYCS